VFLSGADAEAATCDAVLTPIVSGQIDWAILDQLTDLFLTAHGQGSDHGDQPAAGQGDQPGGNANGQPADRPGGRPRKGGRRPERPGQLSPPPGNASATPCCR
jgi:hypothetical protein